MNILIIGATSGIGNGLWRYYASQDNKVAITGRRETLLRQMQKERPNNTLIYPFDMANISETIKHIRKIFLDLRNVDIAIVCAGIGEINTELLLEKEISTIHTNVLGWTAAVDGIYNHFQNQGKGHLVTITSVGGLSGEPAAPAYSATKAYQINYTHALEKKSRKSTIYITEIRPGLVDTAMAKGDNLFWVMKVDKVVAQITKAISEKRRRVVVTKRWRIVSFLLKHILP